MQKMQPQVEFKLIALLLLLLQATWCVSSMMRTGKDWNYFNVQHYDHSHLMDIPDGMNNFEYVDYQARCEQGGEPVCATNGRQEFYFENECKLESHNMKSLFQHGTVLERTDLERCSPNCETIKCPTVYQPVCAAPSEAAADAVHATTTSGVTFGNLCEVRKHECVSQRAMRIVNQGVCRELKLKRRNRKNRNKNRKANRVQPHIVSEQNSSSNVHFLITTRADRMKAAINSSTTSANTTSASTTVASTTRTSPTMTTSTSFTQYTTKSPMRFREFQYSAAPHVSVSQAENPYNIYNIPDVGKDYENIMDNELSVYVPEVGYVTDSPPSTTTLATTTTTATITTTPKPTTTTTMTAATTTTTTLKPTTTTTTTTTPKPKMKTTTPKPLITTYIMTISPSTKRLTSSTTSKTRSTTKAPSWSSTSTRSAKTTSQPLQLTTSTTAKSSSVTTTTELLKTTESTTSTKNLSVTIARVEITTTKPTKPTTTISSTTIAMTTPPTTTSISTSSTTPKTTPNTTPNTTANTTPSTTTIVTTAKMA